MVRSFPFFSAPKDLQVHVVFNHDCLPFVYHIHIMFYSIIFYHILSYYIKLDYMNDIISYHIHFIFLFVLYYFIIWNMIYYTLMCMYIYIYI